MLARLFLFSLFAVLFSIVLANPQPTPAPISGPGLEHRQIDSVVSDASSLAVSAFSVFTSGVANAGGDILTTVTSYGGHLYTIVTSKGGEAITLATSGAGAATSKFGSVYTVATAAISTATSHSGATTLSMGLQTPSLFGLATVMLSTFLGAIIAT